MDKEEICEILEEVLEMLWVWRGCCGGWRINGIAVRALDAEERRDVDLSGGPASVSALPLSEPPLLDSGLESLLPS